MLMGPREPLIGWASCLNLTMFGDQHVPECCKIGPKLLSFLPTARFLLQSLPSRQFFLPLLLLFLAPLFRLTPDLLFLLLSESSRLRSLGHFEESHDKIVQTGFQPGRLPITPRFL